ncbi:MAG: EamA family transporter RarD [Proteobacteria bacterium]|nr:MAG: EamA family transporter RarD [Pseudomonadota bacterium]
MFVAVTRQRGAASPVPVCERSTQRAARRYPHSGCGSLPQFGQSTSTCATPVAIDCFSTFFCKSLVSPVRTIRQPCDRVRAGPGYRSWSSFRGGAMLERDYLKGLVLAWAANLLWGVYPLLFKQLDGLDPGAFVGYRILFSTPFLLLIVFLFRQHHAFLQLWRDGVTLRLLIVSTAMMGLSWGLYVWCVQSGRIVESSIGYYLTPVLNVVVGVVLFRERLDRWQWVAVAMAAAGVLYMAASTGYVPWFGLLLGLAFAVYGAVRKLAQVDAINGVLAETLMLFPVGMALLWIAPSTPESGGPDVFWLSVAGVATALPLIWYVGAARRISMATLGNLFYLCPTLGFLIGVFVYGEPFTSHHLVMFTLIWGGLLMYSFSGRFARPREPGYSE